MVSLPNEYNKVELPLIHQLQQNAAREATAKEKKKQAVAAGQQQKQQQQQLMAQAQLQQGGM